MPAVTRIGLSGSVDGRPIKVDDSDAFPGTAIHTAVNTSGDWDEIWLWAINTSTSPAILRVSMGVTTSGISMVVPPESGLVPVVPGLILAGGTNVLVWTNGTVDVVNIVGYVNRYDADGTPSAVLTKNKLSESTSGQQILVAATGTPGTAIHNAVASNEADEWDEVWLWAWNVDLSNVRKLTLEFGGTTDPDDLIEVTIPTWGAGLTLVVPGLVLHNSAALSAFASETNVIRLMGYVNEIRTP